MYYYKLFFFIDMFELNDKYYNSCDDGCLYEVYWLENLGGDCDSGEVCSDLFFCVKYSV